MWRVVRCHFDVLTFPRLPILRVGGALNPNRAEHVGRLRRGNALPGPTLHLTSAFVNIGCEDIGSVTEEMSELRSARNIRKNDMLHGSAVGDMLVGGHRACS